MVCENKTGKIDIKFLAVFFAVATLFLVCYAYAGATTGLVNGVSNASTSYFNTNNNTYTFTITSTSQLNFTQVNFTLSKGSAGNSYFNFSYGTNSTTASSATTFFTNLTSGVEGEILSFGNATSIIVPNGTSKNFIFVANNSIDGLYNITVTTVDDADATQVLLFNITIDTTAPAIYFNGSTPANWTNTTTNSIFVNVTATDANIANLTFYLMNSAKVILNTTMLATTAIFNSTNMSSGAFINWTALSEGVYYFNVSAMDKALNVNTTTIRKITIDRSGPVATVVSPVNYMNFSRGVGVATVLNASVVDAGIGIIGGIVTFNITNSTGVEIESFPTSVNSSYYFNTTGLNISNATKWPDDTYVIRLITNDTLENNATNVAFSNFTIDSTNPAMAFTEETVTSTAIKFNITVTDAEVVKTCTATRGVSSSQITRMSNTVFTVNDSGLQVATGYEYNITCFDPAGNNGSSTVTYTTTAAAAVASSSGGSGSSTTVPPSVDLSKSDYTKPLSVGDELKFTINNQQHSVSVHQIVGDTVTIKIQSTPQMVTMKVGEAKKVDIDADGVYDLHVQVNSVSGGSASVTIKAIKEDVPPGAGTVGDTATITSAESEGTTGEEEVGSSMWMYIVIAVVIIAIIGVGYYIYKKKG